MFVLFFDIVVLILSQSSVLSFDWQDMWEWDVVTVDFKDCTFTNENIQDISFDVFGAETLHISLQKCKYCIYLLILQNLIRIVVDEKLNQYLLELLPLIFVIQFFVLILNFILDNLFNDVFKCYYTYHLWNGIRFEAGFSLWDVGDDADVR